MAKGFWLSENAARVFEIANAEQKTLQPLVAKLIKEINPKKLLDYGCGDSFVSRLLNKKIEIGLFDINIKEAKKASEHLQDRRCVLYESEMDIPANYFDCIVFSFVLVCLESKEELRQILNNFQKYKTRDGRLVLVTAHPCFRQYDYRSHYTEYTKGKPFKYLNTLDLFEVYIRNDMNGDIHFTDHHWSLSDILNEFISAGFSVERVMEVPDSTYDDMPSNKFYPPFIIITFK